jgi:16S rRNA (guanine527-N7)-methyltransferase
MGTGAGYPAVPLAICRPDWGLVAIDSSAKKVRFVAQTAAALRLPNVLVEHIQAREWHGKVEPFDLIVSRALGSLASVVREGARLLAPDGRLVSYHAVEQAADEARAARQMLTRYKLQQIGTFDYTLTAPDGPLARRLIVMARPAVA